MHLIYTGDNIDKLFGIETSAPLKDFVKDALKRDMARRQHDKNIVTILDFIEVSLLISLNDS